MSLKHAVGRGLEWGRSLFHLGLFKSGARAAAKLRAGPQARSVQPRVLLPARYRYYRWSLRGLAAQLQAAAFRRPLGGGSARGRAAFLAFSVGVGLMEQLEDERSSDAACQEIQAVFRKKKSFQRPVGPLTSGYKLEDYVIGSQIGKGSNAAVYEAAAWPAPPGQHQAAAAAAAAAVELRDEEEPSGRPLTCCSLRSFPLAIKMMWNFGAGSSSEAILTSMSQELVPAGRAALTQQDRVVLDGYFGVSPKALAPHPNVVRVSRVFTADVPLLPGALDEYPDLLPARLHPPGLGNNRTLFLVMKNYPYTLRRFLAAAAASRRQRALMLLQLLEGVAHLGRQGVAHRDLKSDNVLLELDSVGDPRLVISDFGCCLSGSDLRLPFSSAAISRGGNASLMAPEVITAVPGNRSVIDYSKADAWAVGAVAYEIWGQPNPFYGGAGLESRRYREDQLPPLASSVPGDVQQLVALLLRRNPEKRPSARVAANMLHVSLWGREALAGQDGGAGTRELVDWLLCQSALVLLKRRRGNTVEAELQRSFLSYLELEELRAAVGFLLYGRGRRRPAPRPQSNI